MSTNLIFYFAICVFGLMIVGIYLTSLEFKRLNEEPEMRKRNLRNKDAAVDNRAGEATDTA
jgi:hypothetical protein